MANIRKLYESDQTTQLMPQTSEKAVIDGNGTTAETKFGMLFEAYEGLTQSDIVVVADHTSVASPEANTIYREQGESSYTDWMYYNSTWKEMATYDNAIDDLPINNSSNLVKSSGICSYVDTFLEGGTVVSVIDGKDRAWNSTSYPNKHTSDSGWTSNSHNSIHNFRGIEMDDVISVNVKTSLGNLAGDYYAYALLGFGKSSAWETVPEGYVNIGDVFNVGAYFISPESMIVTSTGVRTYDGTPPTGSEYMFVVNYGSYNAKIELTIEKTVEGIYDRLDSIDDSIDSLSSDMEELDVFVNGGELTDVIDGKVVGSKGTYYKTASFTNKNSNSYMRWVITNDNYERVRAYVGLNQTNSNGMCTIAFYNGTAWSVPDSSYILYTNTSARWYEADVPEGCLQIWVGTRKTATSPSAPDGVKIELYKTNLHVSAEKRISDLEYTIGVGKDAVTPKNKNTDQDCLWLRNYIKTTWPYYFATPNTTTDYDALPYLDKKIKNIPDGKHFVFITDTHWQDSPAKPTSTYIASYVAKRLNCPAFFGGDCINSATTKYLAAKAFSVYADEFYSAFGDNGLWVQGNHDSNRLGIDTSNNITAADALIDDTEVYKRSVARVADKVVFDSASIDAIQDIGLTAEEKANAEAWLKLHYYWDDATTKTRYIVYETGCGGVTMYNLVRHGTSYMLPLEYVWVSNTLLSTPKDYDIVVLGHMFGQSHSKYISYSTGNTDARRVMALFRAFKIKGSITINMRAQNTTEGTAFTRALCGTYTNRTFDFSKSENEGRVFVVSGHWHNDRAYMCRYYTDIDGVSGQNGVNIQPYDANDVTADTVIHINVACDTAASGRNTYYTSRSSADVGTTNEILFDVFTITDDDNVVCTRFGYGNDRTFSLTEVVDSGDIDGDDTDSSDDGGSSSDDDNPEEIVS